MSNKFFEHPILNSPYEYPDRHWELDENGQPTGTELKKRRPAEFITPIPKPKKRTGKGQQKELLYGDGKGLSSEEKVYEDTTAYINKLRELVDKWRKIPDPAKWNVTPDTARLLQHWREHEFSGFRPFFCQIEAAETAIWLTEVAPKTKEGKQFIEHIKKANDEANPGLFRIALKLATGAGKTTVMSMIIAWQVINAVRRPTSNRFTKGFLVVTPGITIKDRLNVLKPNDPYSYYKSRELVPNDMMEDLHQARIVITNYHAFKPREKMELSKGGRALLKGRGPDLDTQESEGEMLQRIMPELMGMKRVMVLNDEAHHCYQEKPESEEEKITREEKEEVKKNQEAARLWINGLKTVTNHLDIQTVFDLSATPFFLRGSGYVEGTIFPWVMSDFSLMDAIECGIVKLPRVPVSDNHISREEMPVYRDLWNHLKENNYSLPKSGRSKAKELDPLSLPPPLISALEALYDHYEKTYEKWEEEGMGIPPCFIVVCQNTAVSQLIYQYISGFIQEKEDGSQYLENGRLSLFRNYDEYDQPYSRPNTILVDSEQLESGEALDSNFRKMAKDEIDRYRREIVERTGDQREAENLTDQDLLREVMNTVGKKGRLGQNIRCVVSVSMLTEGWDAQNVTHILGVRAFGTQLLCEQVIGRALRRQSYDLNEDDRFNVEYADILGVPFDFTAKPVPVKPQKPRETVHVHAVSPDRDHLEIRFPRIEGYRVEPPSEQLEAEFTEDSVLKLTPDIVGPTQTKMQGIIGQEEDLNIEEEGNVRYSSIIYKLTQHLITHHWKGKDGTPNYQLFHQMKRITRQWMDQCLECQGGTHAAQLLYQELAERACQKITQSITKRELEKDRPVIALTDRYNPISSTRYVNFNTSKPDRWETDPKKCHVNWAMLDSQWEGEFCRILESKAHPQVLAYVKNHNLGLEVPYLNGSIPRSYYPDFILLIDDGKGMEDPLHLVVEIKGYKGEDAKIKKSTMESYWIPGVNRLGEFGRWDFVELTEPYEMEADLKEKLEKQIEVTIQSKTTETVE